MLKRVLVPAAAAAALCAGPGRVAAAEPASPGDDPAAFVIEAQGSEVHLTGRTAEGTLFAAYALLEELGVRWYMPGDLGTVVPQRRTVLVPAGGREARGAAVVREQPGGGAAGHGVRPGLLREPPRGALDGPGTE